LTSAQKEKLIEDTQKKYEEMQITPGESVGIIAAQSIGEPGTQMTMRTHHFIGVAEFNVTLGLPRIIEVLDLRKEPKTPSMMIYLNAPHSKTRESADKIANRIKQVSLGELAKEISLSMSDFALSISFDRPELSMHGVSVEEIYESLQKSQKEFKVTKRADTINIEQKVRDIKKLYRLKERIKESVISGVKGIIHVLVVERDGEHAIQTFGSNLKSVLQVEEVDEARTKTNSIYEVADVLGIEAARRTIIDEIVKVLEEQGMPVDSRHVDLIGDLMCQTGTPESITRHGITSQKSSVLARASFEIPLKHLVDAAIVGEVDKLTSVVENIMINQPIFVGTGLPDLVVRMNGEKAKAEKKRKEREGRKMSIEKIIKAKENIIIGEKEVLKALKLRQIKEVFVAQNCPDGKLAELNRIAKIAGATVSKIEVAADELAAQMKKPFNVTIVGIKEK
ncbi:MAG: ribosomal L7Ae/L30e/S12e/Gadd45 family protein, partial [archaeon]